MDVLIHLSVVVLIIVLNVIAFINRANFLKRFFLGFTLPLAIFFLGSIYFIIEGGSHLNKFIYGILTQSSFLFWLVNMVPIGVETYKRRFKGVA